MGCCRHQGWLLPAPAASSVHAAGSSSSAACQLLAAAMLSALSATRRNSLVPALDAADALLAAAGPAPPPPGTAAAACRSEEQGRLAAASAVMACPAGMGSRANWSKDDASTRRRLLPPCASAQATAAMPQPASTTAALAVAPSTSGSSSQRSCTAGSSLPMCSSPPCTYARPPPGSSAVTIGQAAARPCPPCRRAGARRSGRAGSGPSSTAWSESASRVGRLAGPGDAAAAAAGPAGARGSALLTPVLPLLWLAAAGGKGCSTTGATPARAQPHSASCNPVLPPKASRCTDSRHQSTSPLLDPTTKKAPPLLPPGLPSPLMKLPMTAKERGWHGRASRQAGCSADSGCSSTWLVSHRPAARHTSPPCWGWRRRRGARGHEAAGERGAPGQGCTPGTAQVVASQAGSSWPAPDHATAPRRTSWPAGPSWNSVSAEACCGSSTLHSSCRRPVPPQYST